VKKLIVIPIMFIYLVAVSGIMVSAHYCGQEMESVSLFTQKAGCDEGECGDESQSSDDCCDDKTFTAKIDTEQNLVSAFKLKLSENSLAAILPAVNYIQVNEIAAVSIQATPCKANAPPGIWQQIPLYKLHARFTYYG
jgi:hypothetical protein